MSGCTEGVLGETGVLVGLGALELLISPAVRPLGWGRRQASSSVLTKRGIAPSMTVALLR